MRISDWSSDVCSSDLAERAQVLAKWPFDEQRNGEQHAPERHERPRPVPHANQEGGLERFDFCQLLGARSEEHTSELQSLMRISYAVFCLKKKIHNKHSKAINTSLTYDSHTTYSHINYHIRHMLPR